MKENGYFAFLHWKHLVDENRMVEADKFKDEWHIK